MKIVTKMAGAPALPKNSSSGVIKNNKVGDVPHSSYKIKLLTFVSCSLLSCNAYGINAKHSIGNYIP